MMESGPNQTDALVAERPLRRHASVERNPDAGTAAANDVLRRLARRALGMSGADIERLVREARQQARRQRRGLCFGDLDSLLSASRRSLSPTMRRRVAAHEAGHVLVRVLLGVGTITAVTIDGTEAGGFVESTMADDVVETEERCSAFLQVLLAGRAAEAVAYGETLAGSGGTEDSDLAKATSLATAMEVGLGFSRTQPLLYRDPAHWQALIRQDAGLAARVNTRLEHAYAGAANLIRGNRSRLAMIVDELLARGTLEGDALENLIERVRTEPRRSP